jgi:type III secretion protein J
LLVLVPIILISCSKVPLFSELHEEEANEIMAHLLEQKIECVKIAAKEGLWILQVPPDDFPLAMHTLQALGLPRQKLMKMGEVFQKSGLVSSPTEERIRFIDALSQELSDTLMKIDGVIAAKVHIALPNNDPLSDRSTPASASVFIKFRAGYDVESSTPDLKNLITKSIEGLTFENVELIMSQADAIPPPPKNDAHGDSGLLAEWQAKLPPWGIPAISAGGGFLIAAILFAAMRSKKPA